MNGHGHVRDLGQHKQLLIDESIVESLDGVTLVMHSPYQDHEPLLVPDRPWEGQVGSYNTIIREDDRLRLWYFTVLYKHPPDATPEDTYEGYKAFFLKYPYDQFLCYAESADGVHWEKPELGIYEFNGSRWNNIVLDPAGGRRYHGCCVFIDPSAEPAARYKMWSPLQALSSPDDAVPAPADGMRRFYSGDGIHWTMYQPDTPNPPGNYDSYNAVFYDVRLNRYVGYKRHWTEDFGDVPWTRYRAIYRWESPDFEQWTSMGELKLTDAADESVNVDRKRPADAPIMDMYTQPVIQHPDNPHLYLMFPSPFWHWGEPTWDMWHKGGFPDRLDVQLAVSRDGINWTRAGARHPLLRPGPTGKADSACVYVFPHLVTFDDETWLYYGATTTKHGDSWWRCRGGIFRARLRRDGFGSADASYQGGQLVTAPLQFSGNTLELNADTSAGGVVRLEILDETMRPVKGFELTDADELNGNDLRMKVTWNNSTNVESLAGKAVRLRFVMRDTRLYAFQFTG